MAKQTAVIIERQFVEDDGTLRVFRHPQWKVECWDAIEALPDDAARMWALEKLLWGLWERDMDVEHVLDFTRASFAERDARARDEDVEAIGASGD